MRAISRLPKKSLLIAATIAVLWITAGIWLPLFYRFLDVGELPQHSDAIVLLGGGRANRLAAAVGLFKQGYAPHMVISGGPLYQFGIDCSTAELDRQGAIAFGIPPDSVIVISHATSTWDEAQLVIETLERHKFRSALIVTDAEHTRRARAVYKKQRPSPEIRLLFVGAGSSFDGEVWWKSEQGFLTLHSEYLKLMFYWVHFGLWPWYW